MLSPPPSCWSGTSSGAGEALLLVRAHPDEVRHVVDVHGQPDGPDRATEESARAGLLDFVRSVQADLPDSDLPARQLLEVRRDLVFLAAEARRQVFRPAVVHAICDAVLAEISRDDGASPSTGEDVPPAAPEHGTTTPR